MGTQTRNFNTQTRNSNMYKLYVFVSLALVASTVALYTPERVASEEQSLDELADADKQTMAPEMEEAGADIEVVDFSDLEMEGQDQEQVEDWFRPTSEVGEETADEHDGIYNDNTFDPVMFNRPGACQPEFGVYYTDNSGRHHYKQIHGISSWEQCARMCNADRGCTKWKWFHKDMGRTACQLQDHSFHIRYRHVDNISGRHDCYFSQGSVC